MRDAAKAQLEALLKVLEILGGKVDAETIEQEHSGTLIRRECGTGGRTGRRCLRRRT